MSRALLLFIILSVVQTASAQRIIDLELVRVYKPSYLISGQPSQAVFTVQNNGPDTISTADSIICFFVYNSNQSNLILRKPLNRLAAGDTMLITINLGVLPPVNTSGSYQFCINAGILNSSADSIKPEVATLTNNQVCRSIYVNGVGINDVESNAPSITAWPNPANDHIVFTIENPGYTADQGIQLYDMQGRFIKTVHEGSLSAGRSDYRADLQDFAPGTYYYRATFNKILITGQFIVFK